MTSLHAPHSARQSPQATNVRRKGLVLLLASLLGHASLSAVDLAITDHGALADGVTVNTAAIQQTIDEVSRQGGGRVIIPMGKFVTGTIYLKSQVTLYLAAAAELLGSRSLSDYPRDNPGSGEVAANLATPSGALSASEFIQALIVADKAKHVAIEGPGVIDGRGQPDAFPVRHAERKNQLGERPMLMRFYQCADVRFSEVTFKNPASWGVHLVDCDNVHFQGVTIRHRSNENNDGIDIDGCRNVFISDCDISSGDDAICPKSSHARPCENIFVKNCVIESDTAAFKLGTSSRAGFRNIVVSDCIMRNTRMGAIKLLCVDGGVLENVLINNIVMDQVEGPIFIRLGNRGAAFLTPEIDGSAVKVGVLRNITISNIQATVRTEDRARSGIMISGIPGHKISGIKLDNIVIRYPGMGPAVGTPKAVPEDPGKYPEQFFFGCLPSYGMYLRHAEDISLSRIKFSFSGEEKRPAMVLEDVAGFSLSDSTIQAAGDAVVAADHSTNLSIANSTFQGSPRTLVELNPNGATPVHLTGNQLPENTQETILRH